MLFAFVKIVFANKIYKCKSLLEYPYYVRHQIIDIKHLTRVLTHNRAFNGGSWNHKKCYARECYDAQKIFEIKLDNNFFYNFYNESGRTTCVPIIPNCAVQKFVNVVTGKYQRNLNVSTNVSIDFKTLTRFVCCF